MRESGRQKRQSRQTGETTPVRLIILTYSWSDLKRFFRCNTKEMRKVFGTPPAGLGKSQGQDRVRMGFHRHTNKAQLTMSIISLNDSGMGIGMKGYRDCNRWKKYISDINGLLRKIEDDLSKTSLTIGNKME